MSNISSNNDLVRGFWDFIVAYLPNYYKRDDVLEDEILFRYLDGDEVCAEDRKWIADTFHNDRTAIRLHLATLETRFAQEALAEYYDSMFCGQWSEGTASDE